MKVYKIMLTVLLIGAVAAGAWYCFTCMQGNKNSKGQTLVQDIKKDMGQLYEDVKDDCLSKG